MHKRYSLEPVIWLSLALGVIIFFAWVPILAEGFTTVACDENDPDEELALQCRYMNERRIEDAKPMWADFCNAMPEKCK